MPIKSASVYKSSSHLRDRSRRLIAHDRSLANFRRNGVTEMVRVRRERRLVHSGCKSHPGTGSFRPVAIGAAVEVTKLLKLPMEEGLKGDSASVQAVT
jgi:hypothetical protein